MENYPDDFIGFHDFKCLYITKLLAKAILLTNPKDLANANRFKDTNLFSVVRGPFTLGDNFYVVKNWLH